MAAPTAAHSANLAVKPVCILNVPRNNGCGLITPATTPRRPPIDTNHSAELCCTARAGAEVFEQPNIASCNESTSGGSSQFCPRNFIDRTENRCKQSFLIDTANNPS